MLIRIDDSVFTVDESEAYTVLRLIKKILIPKLDEVSGVGESVEQLESEVGAIHETNERQETAIQTNRNDINHVLGIDIPTLEGQLANKVDKYNPRVESWNVVKSINGQSETNVGTVDVSVTEIGNVVYFSTQVYMPFTWGSSGDAPAKFAIKLPDTNVKCLLCNGIISQTNLLGYYLTPIAVTPSKYIMVSNKPYNVLGWADMEAPSAVTLTGTGLQLTGFYVKEV